MAFDRTNAADLLALKTELTTDPIVMGYNLNQNVSQTINKLNTGTLNVGLETVQGDLTTQILWELAADNPNDFTPHGQFTVGDQFVMQQLFEITTSLGDDLNWARAKIASLFPTNDGFRLALEALVRRLSRAEVLFGEGTVLNSQDIASALAS